MRDISLGFFRKSGGSLLFGDMSDSFIPAHGGYAQLHSYQKAVVVYEATCYFTRRVFAEGDRTIDQMVQAARSGKQNIVEGSINSGSSKRSELFLTGVARGSLGELAEDYQDFLRTRGLNEWGHEHAGVRRLRDLNRHRPSEYQSFKAGIEHSNPEVSANVILGLTRVTCYLLDRQIVALEAAFLEHGGIRERMTAARQRRRGKGKGTGT